MLGTLPLALTLVAHHVDRPWRKFPELTAQRLANPNRVRETLERHVGNSSERTVMTDVSSMRSILPYSSLDPMPRGC